MQEKFFRYVRSWDEVQLVNIVILRDSRQSICGPKQGVNKGNKEGEQGVKSAFSSLEQFRGPYTAIDK